MRLINTETGRFEEFVDLEKVPPYAILSHTWDVEKGEQSYQEVVKVQEKYMHAPPNSRSDDLEVLTPSEARATSESCPTLSISSEGPRSELEPRSSDIKTPPAPPSVRPSIWDLDSELSAKVRKACEIARRDGYHYIWIDSCCIDKTSSSELSEAINSMFNWYRSAQVCYAFLADVPSHEDIRPLFSKFRYSRWFKRGWTLQELVAPLVVVFLSRDWKGLGTKHGLADLIEGLTSIDRGVLTHEKAVSDESVADRMRWASNRETTRVEDKAYSLLGIFGITMPPLYGEGIYAFRRLQEEILQRIPDQSLFVWGHHGAGPVPIFPLTPYQMEVELTDSQTPFASSPYHFGSNYIRVIQPTEDAIKSLDLPVEEYTRTPHGIRTQLCLLPLKALNPDFRIYLKEGSRAGAVPWYLVVLRSQYARHPQRLLSRLCYLRSSDKADVEFLYLADSLTTPSGNHRVAACDRFLLLLDDFARVRKTLGEIKTVYLPHPKPSAAKRQLEGEYTTLSLTLPMWAQAALQVGGYRVSNIEGPAERNSNSLSFTLMHAAFNIYIHYRHMVTRTSWYRHVVIIEARVWILSPGEKAVRTDTPIQLSPPYASATWVEHHPWAMTLPTRSLNLIAGSGDGVPVTLWLGLDLTAPFQYNLSVDVTPNINTAVGTSSLRPHLKDMQPYGLELQDPHETLNLILLGSARRALETKGYSAHLAFHPSLTLGDSHSHLLTLSTSTGPEEFVIVVKYLHTLDDAYHKIGGPYGDSIIYYQAFEIVARVTLESSRSSDGLETVQDGPYVVPWEDMLPGHYWKWSLQERHVVLTTPAGNSLTLRLGLDLAWLSEYYLNVDIDPGIPQSRPSELSNGCYGESPSTLNCWAQMGLTLSIPEHNKRALQAQGYQVRFEQLDVPGGESESGNSESVHHVLTLSHIQAGVDIVVEYSHRLTTGYPEPVSNLSTERFKIVYPFLLPEESPLQPDPALPTYTQTVKASLKRCYQEMTLLATVRSLCRSDPGGTGVAAPAQCNDTPVTIDWNAHTASGGWYNYWRRHLPRKDLKLTMPTGRQVILRLGFYLVWYTEYCLMVEINPRTPVSRPPSRSDVQSVPDYELSEDGMEYIRQAVGMGSWPGRETHNEPRPVTITTPEILNDGDWEGNDPTSDSDSDETVEINPILPSPSRDDIPPAHHCKIEQNGMEPSERRQSAVEAQDIPLRQSLAQCPEPRQSVEAYHKPPLAPANLTTLGSSSARRGGRWILWTKLRSKFASMFGFGG